MKRLPVPIYNVFSVSSVILLIIMNINSEYFIVIVYMFPPLIHFTLSFPPSSVHPQYCTIIAFTLYNEQLLLTICVIKFEQVHLTTCWFVSKEDNVHGCQKLSSRNHKKNIQFVIGCFCPERGKDSRYIVNIESFSWCKKDTIIFGQYYFSSAL